MKNKLLAMLAVAAIFLPGFCARAADTNAVAAELKDLVAKISASLQEGKRTEAEQADNLKAFDALLAKYKGETNDAVANIAYMKATLYASILQQPAKATEMLKQVESDFPNTATAQRAEQAIASIKQGEEAKKIQDALAAGSVFPDFDVKDLDGKPLAVANFKGKIVMVDFWATWCGPCVQEVPNVVAAYQKYHDKGFEIIGVSLDREGDKAKVISFTKDHNMPWQQFYDGKYWSNELAVKYGVRSIPATYLLDGSGNIIAKNVRGEALEPAVKQALGIQ
jgi:thiol-disulfide isomerase/thioredoxin